MIQQISNTEKLSQLSPLISEQFRFESIEQCDAFKNVFGCELFTIEEQMIKNIESVIYAVCWLCKNIDSVVVGFDENDEIVIQRSLGLELLRNIKRRLIAFLMTSLKV